MKEKAEEVSKGSIVIYKLKSGKSALEVKLEKDTVWLTQKQMTDLFSIERSVITKHLSNIFKSGELAEKSNVQKMHIPFSDKPASFYNLDVIISLGYRVNSSRATQFRIWATKVLKDYLIQGYALNQKRLAEQESNKIRELQETINFIAAKAAHPELLGQSRELLHILHDYSNTLTLLYQYDKNTIPLSKKQKPLYELSYETAKQFIEGAKAKLKEKGEATYLFGQEMEHKFNGIIGSIYQTFDGQDLYPSLEEKAANILYLVIKDHPFADGNKRIGSLLFIYFLERNNYLWKPNGELKITDVTLVALALLMATSSPKEKDIMIKVITNLLK